MNHSFFLDDSKKRALVFGGGGSKGSYEIGVWKALDELEYKPDIVTGTSVGALNGALFILGNVAEAEKMWKQIETGNVLDIKGPLNIRSFKDYRRTLTGFLIKIIREKGISSKPLEDMVNSFVDNEKKIRESGIEFGLSVTNLKTMAVEYFFLDDIEEGKLNDYLLASASAYPAIQKKMIDGVPYVDGGYRNQIPINMALDKKPDQVIVVDIHGPGLLKYDNRFEECDSLWIRTKWPLGDMLLFDTHRTEVNIQLGYYETLKLAVPEKYAGVWYTFSYESVQEERAPFYTVLHELLNGHRTRGLYHFIKEEDHQLPLLKELTKRWKTEITEKNMSLAMLELTGKVFNMIPDRKYEVADFQDEIRHRLTKMRDEEHLDPVEEFQPRFILSGKEWSEEFFEGLPMISNRSLISQILDKLEDDTMNWDNPFYRLLIMTRPFPFVIALYCKYLLEKQDI
ncbi:patatin-like phospholipase family protein [Alkalibacterium olivapovliticus]|uniref:NTE family protein n=1 Tax=Alkalibacterium olivapovliticus TaxID=99907 RepID=A0A2T0WAW6_9LACT|nr:patatin-like phospholipase family protein [Alkalibacterium olivapovliticus]PRY83842.1 NTE family protein [Alkalibacterium olivapovliticus]